jgi:hypothetical protein
MADRNIARFGLMPDEEPEGPGGPATDVLLGTPASALETNASRLTIELGDQGEGMR